PKACQSNALPLSYPVSLRIFILFHPSPTHETWQYETGVIPFNPDRKVDAGAQHEDLHTGVEPWGQRGRQAASMAQQRHHQSLSSQGLLSCGATQLPASTLQPTVKTLAALSLPLET
ncbi:mCG146187, partial [Mus musculus]